MNALSIIIPSRNAANLVPCVRAIRDAGETCRIIVMDDGLDWAECESNGKMFHLPSLERINGADPFQFSRNVNIGIRAAGTDDVVICNDDALLKSPNGFTLLQLAQEQNPQFGIIGATTHVTGQPLQHPRRGALSGLRFLPHIAFMCVFIPRRTLDTIGLLDERYVCGYEDRDYCEAVNRAGQLVGVHDGCYVDHGSLVSTVRGPGGKGYDARGSQQFNEKWGMPYSPPALPPKPDWQKGNHG